MTLIQRRNNVMSPVGCTNLEFVPVCKFSSDPCVFSLHEFMWRHSALCQFAGFLSTFSSELSVFTLTLITIDRLIAISFPFRIKRLGMREARLVMFVLWLLVFMLSAVPFTGIAYFKEFYARSGVCLALHITPDKPTGWQYSVFVFLALNMAFFLTILISYIWMFIVARQTRSAARSTYSETKGDRAMARRMTLIILTDFCCWVPIILLGIASLGGATVPPQVSVMIERE